MECQNWEFFYPLVRWPEEGNGTTTLAWKIPWTEEPSRLQSMESRRVGHDWVTWLSLFTFMHWRRKWQPTPVFLPGESQGQRNLVGYSPWGHKELDTTSDYTRRRQWHPTPVLLPRKSRGWGSLVGCHPWGRRVGHDWSNLAAAVRWPATNFSKSLLHNFPPCHMLMFTLYGCTCLE